MISWFLFGCTAPNVDGPIPHDFVDHFFDRPWPNDLRTIDGRPDLSDWEDRGTYDLLDRFIDLEMCWLKKLVGGSGSG